VSLSTKKKEKEKKVFDIVADLRENCHPKKTEFFFASLKTLAKLVMLPPGLIVVKLILFFVPDARLFVPRKPLVECREPLPKGKAQYRQPPCTN